MVYCLLNAQASTTSISWLALIYTGGAVAWKLVSDSSLQGLLKFSSVFFFDCGYFAKQSETREFQAHPPKQSLRVIASLKTSKILSTSEYSRLDERKTISHQDHHTFSKDCFSWPVSTKSPMPIPDKTCLHIAMVLGKSICQGDSCLWQQTDFPHTMAKIHLGQLAPKLHCRMIFPTCLRRRGINNLHSSVSKLFSPRMPKDLRPHFEVTPCT